MNGTITGGSSTITPTIILAVSEQSPGGSIVHPILGRPNPDVTLRVAGLRSGRLELGFDGESSEEQSATARDVLRAGAVFTLVTTDRTSLGFSFVVAEGGQVERALETETRNAWLVYVDYQEVAL